MDYVKQMDAFYNRIEVEPLSEYAISLWHSLMYINSRTVWSKEYTVPTATLRSKASLSESALKRARKELEKKGYIIVQSRRGNQSPVYQIVCLTKASDRRVDTNKGSNRTVPMLPYASSPDSLGYKFPLIQQGAI